MAKKSKRRVGGQLVTSSAILGAALFAPVARAATITVTSLGDNLTTGGPTDCTLREAIANANNDAATFPDCAAGSGTDLVQVSVPSGTILLSLGQIAITTSLTVDGPDGALPPVSVNGNNTTRIFYIVDNTTLQDVTIQDLALINGNAFYPGGGAILNRERLTVSNVDFRNNRASYSSGGAIRSSAELTINGSYFTGNLTDPSGDGGAVYQEGKLTVTTSDFVMNTTKGDGGAIAVRGETTITGSTFTSNHSQNSGGAVNLLNTYPVPPVTVTSSNFTSNTAGEEVLPYGIFGEGGAIQGSGIVTITGGSFTMNSARNDGGALSLYDGSLILDGVTLSNNSTLRGRGGAISLEDMGSAIIRNNTQITGNSTGASYGGDGGGIYALDVDSVQILQSSITNNTARRDGGGALIGAFPVRYGGTPVSLTITDATITGNSSLQGEGGGLALGYLQPGASISDSTIETNDALNGPGGGIALKYASDLNITGTTISTNQARSGGGIFSRDGGTLTLASSVTGGTVIDGNIAAKYGGGIAFSSGTLIVTDALIQNNSASKYGGGGIAISSGTLTVTNTVIQYNDAGTGGGLYLSYTDLSMSGTQVVDNEASQGGGLSSSGYGASLAITNSTFRLNDATSGPGGAMKLRLLGGGGAAATAGSVAPDGISLYPAGTLNGVTISDNTATQSGGGIFAYELNGILNITDSTISSNDSLSVGGGIALVGSTTSITGSRIEANTSLSYGGGLSFAGGFDSLTVTSSTIASNMALYAAGVFAYGNSGDVVAITDSTISGNDAMVGGGGLYVAYVQLQMTNDTVSGNRADFGGGAELRSLATGSQIRFTTINNNIANVAGGGLRIKTPGTYASGSLLIENSIVANNSNGDIVEETPAATTPDIRFTLIEDPSNTTYNDGGGNIIGQDPQLGPLASNGGPTLTHLPAPSSPVVDSGDPAFVPPPSTDQRGLPREKGPQVDMGAVELQAGVVNFSSLNYFVDENAGTVTITVVRSDGSDPVSVDVVLSSGSGTVGTDITPVSQTAIFGGVGSPNQNIATVTFNINDDLTFENGGLDETITLSLANPQPPGMSLGPSAVLNIVENDPQPSITISDVTATEGTTVFAFTASLSNPSTQTVTVNFATADGTAIAGSDYNATSGILTFNPGETSKTINVPVIPDTLNEASETFNVNLSGATNATIADATGVGTITDDDPAPALSITDVTQTEGDTGLTNFAFTVTLSAPSGQTVNVNFATADGTANAGSDYTATSGTLTFNPGQTSTIVNVPVIGDTLDEVDETFNVNLSGATNASIADATGAGTITDDDAAPAISISDVTQTEGNAGTTNFAFNVTLSAPSGQAVTVNFTTADGTATSGSDYTATSGTLTLNPGQTSNIVNVMVTGDTVEEPNETFNVNLSGATNATIADATGVGTITNDDVVLDMVQFGASTFSVNENGGSASVTVTRNPAGGGPVTVNYSTSDGSAIGGTPTGVDYTTSSGTLTFAPGEMSKTITIPITNDSLDEVNETFTITLSAPMGATLGSPASTTVTIVDDDASPALSISDVTELEGTGSNSQFLFTIQLSSPSTQPITVDYATSDGTANAGSDYFANSGTITFAPGETMKVISIGVVGDAIDENDETFLVTLSNAIAASIARGTATATIRDDDGAMADLAITTTYDRTAPVPRFDPLVWIAEVVNNGANIAEGVRVVIRRPVDNPSDRTTETAYKILTPATCVVNRTDQSVPAGAETTTVTFDVISCDIGTLAVNSRARVEILSLADPARAFTADGTDVGQVNHTASVTAATPDSNPNNNTSGWAPVELNGVAARTELLIRDLRDPVAPGGEVTYTVARSGQPLPEDVPIGDLELDPSDNLTVVSLPPGCSTVEGEVTAVLIRCTAFTPFGDFVFQHNNPGATGDIGSLRGELLVFNPASAANETVAEGLELTTIGAGALTGDVSVGLGGPSTVLPGVPATFTLSVRNDGPQVANNVTIDISSSEAVIALIGDGSLRVEVNGASGCAALPCTIGSLAPGETRNIQFTVTAAPTATVIRVVASVTTSAFDPNASNNVVTFETQLACAQLDAPQIFVVGSVTSEQPYSVTWTAVSDADAYILEESTTRDFGDITESQQVTGTSVQFVKVVFNPREFYYRVRAVTDCGDAAESVSSVVQTLIEPKPSTLVEPTTSTPFGSVQPVVTSVTVFSPDSNEVPYVAESDQPWVIITPRTGVLLPAPTGTQLQVSIDPTGLPVGAQTATIILRRPDALTTGPNQSTGSSTITQVPISISLVTPVTTASKTSATADALIIPVVAHAQGASGEFRSDVRIFNSAFRRVAHRVLFTPTTTDGRTSSLTTNLNIEPGQTVAMDDILRKWFGLGSTAASSASGLIEIRPLDSPTAGSTIATSRTYRIGADGSGTRGEYIAAVPVAKFLGRTPQGSIGGKLNLQQLAQNAQFRTNLGLVEGAGAATSVLVRAFDNQGRLLFTQPVNLKPGEHQQLNSIFAQKGIAVNDARIEVTNTGGTGRVTAYASVLDAMTSDALHITGLNVDEVAANEVVVAGVAELQGQASRWRTDMRIYNASDRPSNATLQFYRQGSTEIASEATVAIGAGEVLSLDNVVGTTLGQLNTLGAIHVVTNEALVVTARTFNQLAANGATQGQFIPAITPAEGIRLGGKPLHMLNVEQSVNFRTNLGLAEMDGSPVRVEVTAIPPDSRAVVRTELVLGGNEFRQISNILAQMGLPTVYNARITARVIDGGGRLTAYASAIDNRTDDAIFVAAKQ